MAAVASAFAVAAAKKPMKEMALEAIGALEPRGKKGVSVVAVKNYISANWAVDMARGTGKHYLSKFLHEAVERGLVVQVTGTGASGSVRLGEEGHKLLKKKKKAAPKPKATAAAAKPKTAKKTVKQPAVNSNEAKEDPLLSSDDSSDSNDSSESSDSSEEEDVENVEPVVEKKKAPSPKAAKVPKAAATKAVAPKAATKALPKKPVKFGPPKK